MSRYKKLMYWLGGFIVIVFVIPNTTNFKERNAFSDERRLESAMALYSFDKVADSVTLVPGKYYKRNKVSTLFLGQKYRDLWTSPVTVKVLQYDEVNGGMKPDGVGGGQQTISIKLEDADERKWSLRSVGKDQQYVLPRFFRYTCMRFLARDQLAAANPYGQLVVPTLADAVGVFHMNPQLVLVPYNEEFGQYNERMAGRLAYLEESPGGSWKKSEVFGFAEDILNSEEMFIKQREKKIGIDTLLYLKTRLFDMLLSDWDRHPGNWEWALLKQDGAEIFKPIPKDRDNVFFQFDEGLVAHITLMFMPKFQSFRKKFGSVKGLMHQSRELDRSILASVDQKTFEKTAQDIQTALTDDIIRQALQKYPPTVYGKVGARHEEILKARLKQLPEVARQFHRLTR
jgi:hypothetical protein